MAKLMDISELASYLKLEKQTIYNWLHRKKISGIKVGGVWRFDRKAIDKWLKSQIVPASNRGRSIPEKERRDNGLR